MTLSILIVNWNSRDYLRRCLVSIRDTCAELSPQIVVVDGGSFDGCDAMLAAEFPEVEFVQSADNIGFGRSNNLGFERVTGEALLLLNPDTEVRPGAVARLLAELERLPQAGILGARQSNTDGSLQLSSIHPLPTPWNAAFTTEGAHRRHWRRIGAWDAADPVEVEAVSGACMMMRAETFRRLGGFDPRYFMYAEDMDLCFRIQRLGLKIYHVPEAEIVHHGGGSARAQLNRFSTVMLREAVHAYFRKNAGVAAGAAFRVLTAVSAVARLLLLATAWTMAGGETRRLRLASMSRWHAALRWSSGFEGWSRDYCPPRGGGKPVTSLSPCCGSAEARG